jgi:hypothetical protein
MKTSKRLSEPSVRLPIAVGLCSGFPTSFARLCGLRSNRSLKIVRPELQRLARQGRLWLRQVTTCHADSKLLINTNFKQLEVEVNLFCDQIDAIRREYGGAVKAGPPRRRLLLQVFIGEMIGIAKLVKVLPSTPGRAILPTRPPPAFFGFVKEALAISRKVVRTSSLTEAEKKSALSVFSVRGDEALVKQIELVRGRIGDYRDTPHGLSEWPKS